MFPFFLFLYLGSLFDFIIVAKSHSTNICFESLYPTEYSKSSLRKNLPSVVCLFFIQRSKVSTILEKLFEKTFSFENASLHISETIDFRFAFKYSEEEIILPSLVLPLPYQALAKGVKVARVE